MLLPHNNEVTKPYALNTFLDELAELRIDEGLIKNKKLRSDLIEKKKASEMPKILPITKVIMRRVHRVERKRGRRKMKRKWLLRMVLKLKTPKRATATLKTTVRKQKVVALKRPPPFTLKIPVNIVRILKCTEH